ncbi:MAG: sigma-54-dependent transcriptional regulator [Nitrospirota bacterium]
MAKEKILIVDDDAGVRDVLVTLLEGEGYEVTSAEDALSAIEAVKDLNCHLLLTDLRLPKMDGIDLLKEVSAINPSIIGIILTGHGTIETAVKAMRAGAFDYLTKPFQLDEVLMIVKRAIEYTNLQHENITLRKTLKTKYRFENIVGDSEAIQRVFKSIEKIADSDSTILILGESGTGKEVLARTIHFNSSRSNKPLIPVHCGAIPETLLESELFGHEKGSFTGAYSSRTGRFELANGGTIFLDEIGEMSPTLQVKLLRVLQEREFERVGGTKTIKVDIRIIAATNKDLEKEVEKGSFREDLYYRLNVIPVTIPPLRERREDIPLLLNHFIEQFNKKKNKDIKAISDEAMSLLMEYRWPGNIREVENLVERLAILKGEGIVIPSDLPEKINQKKRSDMLTQFNIPDDGIDFTTVVDEFENRLIIQALEKAAGVKNKAAQLLKLNRTTLVEKIKKKKLEHIAVH